MNEAERELAELVVADRLRHMGVAIRSAELSERRREFSMFKANGGNRAMRRRAKRATKKRGR